MSAAEAVGAVRAWARAGPGERGGADAAERCRRGGARRVRVPVGHGERRAGRRDGDDDRRRPLAGPHRQLGRPLVVLTPCKAVKI